jgi:hypothetical protein
MKQLFTLSFILLSQKILFAQVPEDALRMSWTAPGGTARQQAIGGAMGSLGGEISAVFVNPAGLGMYKKGEFVVSPGFQFQKINSNYLGKGASGNTVNNFNLGASGFVFSFPARNGNTNALSIAVNRTANFNGNYFYKAQNNFSSFSEQYLEEYKNSGLSIDDINGAINNPLLSYGTRMALYTYLIDTATIAGQHQVIAQPLKAGLLNQENNTISKGGITEIALSIAANNHDKWYIGGSLGIPIMNYSRNMTFTESDATGNTNNDFGFSTYNEIYDSKGVGINAKLGAIFRPINSWRIGLAVHTPTLYAITDNISAKMVTNTDKYNSSNPEISVTSAALDQATGTNPGMVKYDLVSPWKFIVSGSYVFEESEDVTKQRGFVTADIEFVTNNGSHFNSADNTSDNNYFSSVNSTIKSYYKSSFNFRLGGELKFNSIAARAGVAYYMNPYRQSELKADRLILSGGIGYRNKGVFIDLTYVQDFTRDLNFPYRLAENANAFASLKESIGSIFMTVGFKFD